MAIWGLTLPFQVFDDRRLEAEGQLNAAVNCRGSEGLSQRLIVATLGIRPILGEFLF